LVIKQATRVFKNRGPKTATSQNIGAATSDAYANTMPSMKTAQFTFPPAIKDAMLVLFEQNCLHLLPYLSSESYSRKYEKLPNKDIYAC